MFCGSANADYYIFDENNQAVARTQYEPSQEDLSKRGHFYFKSKKDFNLTEVEYFQNKIRKRPLSQEEKNVKKVNKDKAAERKLINQRMRKMAIEDLEKEGHVFQYFKKDE